MALGGANAADVIMKHGKRICSLHLKDLARDAKSDLANPKSAHPLMVRLSAGRVEIPAVFAAAKAKGVSNFIIEDESPNAGSQLPKSFQAVKGQLSPVPRQDGAPSIKTGRQAVFTSPKNNI